jgi:hypothetical protein
MSRTLGMPTTGTPWYAKWTGPSLDLGAIGTVGPVEVTSLVLPPAPAPSPTMLTCTFGANTDGANPEWHLTAENTTLGGNPDSRAVMAVMSAISATTPTPRSTQRSNAFTGPDFDVRVSVPIQFDLRSVSKGPAYKYYIALAHQGGATNCYLLDILATTVAL